MKKFIAKVQTTTNIFYAKNQKELVKLITTANKRKELIKVTML